jgi:hypothetical protein
VTAAELGCFVSVRPFHFFGTASTIGLLRVASPGAPSAADCADGCRALTAQRTTDVLEAGFKVGASSPRTPGWSWLAAD